MYVGEEYANLHGRAFSELVALLLDELLQKVIMLILRAGHCGKQVAN